MKTLTLTNEEFYALSCIAGHFYPSGVLKGLFDKLRSDLESDLECEDYSKVKFEQSFVNDTYVIYFKEEN